MNSDEIKIGNRCEMNDGRVAHLVHEFDAPDGHWRVESDVVIEGQIAGTIDMSLNEFASKVMTAFKQVGQRRAILEAPGVEFIPENGGVRG